MYTYIYSYIYRVSPSAGLPALASAAEVLPLDGTEPTPHYNKTNPLSTTTSTHPQQHYTAPQHETHRPPEGL